VWSCSNNAVASAAAYVFRLLQPDVCEQITEEAASAEAIAEAFAEAAGDGSAAATAAAQVLASKHGGLVHQDMVQCSLPIPSKLGVDMSMLLQHRHDCTS
jgi:hypothetical protein